MKSINRRALSALLFGFLTFGASASFSQEPTKEHSCSSECCKEKPAKRQASPTSANSYMNQWFKAKYGREYPLNKPAAPSQPATHRCC